MVVEVADHVRVVPAALGGTVRVPGDKSVSHRALILGALAGGPVAVSGVAPSGDVASTAAALRLLGADVDLAGSADGQLAGTVRGPVREPTDVLDCGNSGTSMRLLAGVVAAIDGLTVMTGDASLRRRPMGRVIDPLRRMGARVDARGSGLPPLAIRGGELEGISYDSPVASAQVKSCLLLAGLAAQGPTTVRSPARSRDHTERMLRHLGAQVHSERDDDGGEIVRLTPSDLRPAPLEVPADPSSAAFWIVAAAAGAGRIACPSVCANPARFGVVDVLTSMGASIDVEPHPTDGIEPVADVTSAPSDLDGASIGGETVVDAIDELPVLALAGAVSAGGLEVRDAAELRVKESDRIAALAGAFEALGLEMEQRPDGYRVPGRQRPGPGTVHANGDHRIAMTAAIAATIGTGPVEIRGFASVATSYPTFLDDLRRLGGHCEVLATAPAHDHLSPAAGPATTDGRP